MTTPRCTSGAHVFIIRGFAITVDDTRSITGIRGRICQIISALRYAWARVCLIQRRACACTDDKLSLRAAPQAFPSEISKNTLNGTHTHTYYERVKYINVATTVAGSINTATEA